MGCQTLLFCVRPHHSLILRSGTWDHDVGFLYLSPLTTMDTDLFTAAKALLDLIHRLPTDQWADTFASYSALEVRELANAVRSTEDCIQTVEWISADFGE